MGQLIQLLKLWNEFRALTLALVLPAMPYVALGWFMPAQYRHVVVDATSQGLPLIWAVAVMLVYLALLILMLAAASHLRPAFVSLAVMPFVAAIWSFTAATGLTLQLGVIVLLTSIVGASAVLLSRRQGLAVPAKLRSVWVALGIGFVLFFGSAVASLGEPLAFPKAIGSLAVLAFSIGTIGLWACAMSLKPKFALVSIAYCTVAALLFDPNNHQIPPVKAKSPPQELNQAFATWLSSRRDMDSYRSRKKAYPVIFVSSEGGGIYAAAHAYGTLTAIAQNCPTFNQHVFATVGVSGGALGNVLYAAAADQEQKPYSPCQANGRVVDPKPVTTDHLSPVLARLLLVETVDRLLPGQSVTHDRGQILTDSFLSVTADRTHSAAALSDSFDPTSARPALISVTTDRESGNRLILSPFQPRSYATAAEWWPGSSPFSNEAPRDDSLQISAINAAGLSARFPWVTPTGQLNLSGTQSRILADGGYFDNSGAETVADLIDAIKIEQNWDRFWNDVEQAQDPADRTVDNGCAKIKIRIVKNFFLGDDGAGDVNWKECEIPVFLIYFALASSEPVPEQDVTTPAGKDDLSQSFIGDPLEVLLATRRSRGNNALNYNDFYFCGMAFGSGGAECAFEPGSSTGMFRNNVHPKAWQLPLGWFMSGDNFNSILRGTADPQLFDYRRLRNAADTETELMIYHLDPGLTDEGASPSLSDLMGNFVP